LDPKANGIVVQTDETSLALIKLRRVEPTAVTGEFQPVAQRTTPRSESFALYRFISPKIHGTVAVRWHADDRGRRFATLTSRHRLATR